MIHENRINSFTNGFYPYFITSVKNDSNTYIFWEQIIFLLVGRERFTIRSPHSQKNHTSLVRSWMNHISLVRSWMIHWYLIDSFVNESYSIILFASDSQISDGLVRERIIFHKFVREWLGEIWLTRSWTNRISSVWLVMIHWYLVMTRSWTKRKYCNQQGVEL